MSGPQSKQSDRLTELRTQIAQGTYRLNTWALAELLVAHPDARAALDLPPLLSARRTPTRRAS